MATKLLKELHREARRAPGRLLRWTHTFCGYAHRRSRTQRPAEQVAAMLKTVALLGEPPPPGPPPVMDFCWFLSSGVSSNTLRLFSTVSLGRGPSDGERACSSCVQMSEAPPGNVLHYPGGSRESKPLSAGEHPRRQGRKCCQPCRSVLAQSESPGTSFFPHFRGNTSLGPFVLPSENGL